MIEVGEDVRRVYALPAEMLERIYRYQADMNLPSEVAAVRKLLDQALAGQETMEALTDRLLERVRGTAGSLSDAARDVLVGHPLVRAISFGVGTLSFQLSGGEGATVTARGEVVLP